MVHSASGIRPSGIPIFIIASYVALASSSALGFARPISSAATITRRRAINSGSSPPAIIRASQYTAASGSEPLILLIKCRYDIVVHLPTLVVCLWIALKAFCHHSIINNYRLTCGVDCSRRSRILSSLRASPPEYLNKAAVSSIFTSRLLKISSLATACSSRRVRSFSFKGSSV